MANKKLDIETVPVTVHVAVEDYNRLRSSLILRGKKKSFSKWVRIIMHDFLEKQDKQEDEKKLQETISEK